MFWTILETGFTLYSKPHIGAYTSITKFQSNFNPINPKFKQEILAYK